MSPTDAPPLPRAVGAYQLLSRCEGLLRGLESVGEKGEMWAARVAEAGSLGRLRQVSMLQLVRTEDPDALTLVLDQARLVARIEHPNVGRVLDVGTDPPHVVVEWLAGASLARIARATASGSRLPVQWVLAAIVEVLAGLHAAHEATDTDGAPLRLVHRDVSPEHVIVTFDGRVKVVGFAAPGARRGQAVTRVLGSRTPYFAPEQVAGAEIDRRADVFSAGALLYLLLTGVHPFAEAAGPDQPTLPVETMQRISNNPVARPSALVPGLSSELDAIVLQALAKDPKARFQTAAALQRAIESLPEARPRPTEQEIGKVVCDLFPGEAEERASELARAVERADAADEARAAAAPRPVPRTPEARSAPPLPRRRPPRTARPPALLASRGEIAFGVGAVAIVGLAALLSPAPAPAPAPTRPEPRAPAAPTTATPPKAVQVAPIPEPEPASEPTLAPSTSSKPPRGAPRKTFAPKGL